ncbi:MAG TPA: hypothetical protein DEO70_02870 [Bacteroidales bacterium]|nr:MAG: hypothetical protein A2X11_14270 [Bacteroidetes bacterium GWE2_42_24]OFY30021.1 MAG: hypothetical protein A2X09_14420 [Bacteroidetes bacterium GWF2_43_11]HBZ65752.1 hypothetical protein [Bacteroidales bacterium]
MIDTEDIMFSGEYNTSETTETMKTNNSCEAVFEQTTVSEQVEYSVSKPLRIIIKAVIKND